MSSDLDGATKPSPPGTQNSTPGAFAAAWNSHTEEERQGWLNVMHEMTERGRRCWLEMHDDRLRRR